MKYWWTLLPLFMFSTAVAAQGTSPRAGQMEFTVGLAHSFSESVDGRFGSSLDLSSRTGLQAGFDYFATNRLSLGFDATWVRPSYDAVLVPEDGSPDVSVSTRASIFNGQVNATFNFIEGPWTPYIEGSLGWTYFDSNVSADSPVTGCWWDPWWGYICSSFYSTYNDTNFSYGVGAGLRWDLNRELVLKLGYRMVEVEFDNSQEKPRLDMATLEIGWKY